MSAPRGSTSTVPVPSPTTQRRLRALVGDDVVGLLAARCGALSPLPVVTLRQLRCVTVARYQTHGSLLIGAVSGPLSADWAVPAISLCCMNDPGPASWLTDAASEARSPQVERSVPRSDRWRARLERATKNATTAMTMSAMPP